MRAAAWLAALALCAAPGAAWAGPWDVYGFGARALGMGGAAVASAEDHTATWYNPALLSAVEGPHLGVDLHAALPRLSVDAPQASAAYAPPEVGARGGLSLGLAAPLWRGWALGLAAQAPFGELLSVRLLDPQVPQWYRYDTLPQKLHAVGALSWAPLGWLRLGAGAQYLGAIDGEARIGADLSNRRLNSRALAVELQSRWAPVLGVAVEPGGGWRLGASWRGALGLNYALPLVVDLGEGADVVIGARGVSLYVPDELTLGLGLARPWGAVSVEAAWSRWGAAPRPAADLWIDVQGELPDALGLGDALDFAVAPEAAPAFVDTWSWRAGGEAALGGGWSGRAGLSLRPSALSEARPGVNYLDGDAWSLSGGLGWRGEGGYSLEGAAQWTWIAAQAGGGLSPGDPAGPWRAQGQLWTLLLSAARRL
jgi:hypothetical protein